MLGDGAHGAVRRAQHLADLAAHRVVDGGLHAVDGEPGPGRRRHRLALPRRELALLDPDQPPGGVVRVAHRGMSERSGRFSSLFVGSPESSRVSLQFCVFQLIPLAPIVAALPEGGRIPKDTANSITLTVYHAVAIGIIVAQT